MTVQDFSIILSLYVVDKSLLFDPTFVINLIDSDFNNCLIFIFFEIWAGIWQLDFLNFTLHEDNPIFFIEFLRSLCSFHLMYIWGKNWCSFCFKIFLLLQLRFVCKSITQKLHYYGISRENVKQAKYSETRPSLLPWAIGYTSFVLDQESTNKVVSYMFSFKISLITVGSSGHQTTLHLY